MLIEGYRLFWLKVEVSFFLAWPIALSYKQRIDIGTSKNFKQVKHNNIETRNSNLTVLFGTLRDVASQFEAPRVYTTLD